MVFAKKSTGLIFILACLLVLCFAPCRAQYYPVVEKGQGWVRFAYGDANGKPATEFIYDRTDSFKNEIGICTLFGAKTGQNWGALDKNLKIIVPFKYEFIDFRGGLIAATYSYRYGDNNYDLYKLDGSLVYQCHSCIVKNIEHDTLFYIVVDTSTAPNSSSGGATSPSRVTEVYKPGLQKLFTARGYGAGRIFNSTAGKANDFLANYITIKVFYPNPGKLYHDERVSVYDLTGKLIIDTIHTLHQLLYNPEINYNNNCIAINYGNRAELVDTFFKPVLPFSKGYQKLYFPHPELINDSLVGFEKNNKYGLMLPNEEIVVRAVYDAPLLPKYAINGFDAAVKKESRLTDEIFVPGHDEEELCINLKGDTVLKPGETLVSSTRSLNGSFIVKAGGSWQPKYGIRAKNGATIAPLKYDYMCEIDSNTFAFFKGDSAGFINARGKELIRVKAQAITPLSEGVFAAWPVVPNQPTKGSIIGPLPENKPRLININGKVIPTDDFEYALPCMDGVISLGNGKKYWDIDKQGKPFIHTPGHRVVSQFSNDVAGVADTATRLCGLVNTKGDVVVKAQYYNIKTVAPQTYLAGWWWPARAIEFTHDKKRIPEIVNGKFYVQTAADSEWVEVPLPTQ